MKRSALWATATLAGCLSLCALAGIALAGNPHGTPPGQANGQSAQSSQSSQSSSSTCTASPSQGAGVKPNNTTMHNTCATADSHQTKMYGNGKTAGGIAMSRGAPGSTKLYGPGNSQPHKVATCPGTNGKVHYKDVHAVKSYSNSSCSSSSAQQQTQQTQQTQSSTPAAPAASASASATSPAAPAAAGVAGATKTLKSGAAPAAKTSPRSGVLGATARTGTLPFTGMPLWIPALAALGLLAAGLGLRRHAGSRA
jgi:hypothetical protein